MDILAAAFFVVAGAWLLLACVYSGMVLFFLRLRSRGELGTVYETEFGRLYLFGSRYYIPFGWLFRSYLRHLQGNEHIGGTATRVMNRVERRQALQTLLSERNKKKKPANKTNELASSSLSPSSQPPGDVMGETGSVNLVPDGHDDQESSQEPVCSICLGEYTNMSCVLTSSNCPHQFHQDCILDWLQIPGNTLCPCCRVAMVSEDDVWKVVKANRKQQQKASKKRGGRKTDKKVENSSSFDESECDRRHEIAETLPRQSSAEDEALEQGQEQV